MSELWKPLYYNGEYFGDTHLISSTGKLMGLFTGRVLRTYLGQTGYHQVCISRTRKRKIIIKIHRAVAENFLANDKALPFVNHIDGNKTNNALSNLEWCTAKHNSMHAVKTGLRTYKRGSACSFSKLSDDAVRNIRNVYDNRTGSFPATRLAEMYGVSRVQIFRAARRETYKNVV